jgi:hypothetical protein
MEVGLNARLFNLSKRFHNDQMTDRIGSDFDKFELRTNSYLAVIANPIAELPYFLVSFSEISRFSFHFSSKTGVLLLDEEKDLNVEVILKIRDILSRGCECSMNYACDTALFVILTN